MKRDKKLLDILQTETLSETWIALQQNELQNFCYSFFLVKLARISHDNLNEIKNLCH